MIAYGNTTDRILLLLKDNELTKIEICQKLNLTHDQVSSVLTRLNREGKQTPKRIYISDWTRNAVGKRLFLRPVFKAGAKADAERPKPFTNKERSAKHHRKKMLIKRSQIFRIAA